MTGGRAESASRRRTAALAPGAFAAVLLAACLLQPAAALAQGQNVRGRVVDASDDRALVGAQVTLIQDGRRLWAVTSDSTGGFMVGAPQPGEYHVEAELSGYVPILSDTLVLGPGDTVRVEIRLPSLQAAAAGVLGSGGLTGAVRGSPAARAGVSRDSGAPLPLAITSRMGESQGVVGRVIDDASGRGLASAVIGLFQDERRLGSTTSFEDGVFAIGVPGPGNYQLEAEALGFRQTRSQAFYVERDDTLNVEFRVLPDAILLNPILVTARSNRGRDAFDRRMAEWGQGIFLTPEMIDSIAPSFHAAEVFRNQEDIWLSWGWGRSSTGQPGIQPNIRTFKGSGCMRYMLNRLPAGGGFSSFPMDGLLPQDIVAVEIYRSIGEAPPELRQAAGRGEGLCGLTVFWTREGW